MISSVRSRFRTIGEIAYRTTSRCVNPDTLGYHRLMRSWLLAVVLVGGCYHPSPPAGAPCNSRGECPSGLECVDDICQEPGALPVDAAIDACPETACVGDDLVGCGSQITCALGCAAGSTAKVAHCMEMVPSNGVTPALLVGATADLSDRDFDFDTDTGVVTKNSGMPVRPAGTGVINGIGFTVIDKMAVFSVHSVDVPALVSSDDDWDVAGDNAIVIYAATTIKVAGRIDAGASGGSGGPSGGNGATSLSTTTCRGRGGLWQMAAYGEGGGGGGARTAGGNGAPSNTTTFGVGGVLCTALPSTIPLRGGLGGGVGGYDTVLSMVHGGQGGGGGGAIGIVAMESITITGQVTAPGDGGRSPVSGDGGGGGGAGGAILVEAPVVTISGALTANGGGGGAPSTDPGSRGHISDGSAASGGVFNTGAGGRGSTGTQTPGNGTTFIDATPSARGGGGGGAAGRAEIKSRTRTTTGAVLSPAPTLNDIATQ